MSYKLFGPRENSRVSKVLAAASLAGLTVEMSPFKMDEDNKTEAYKKIHPLGKVPAFQTPHGTFFESNAILRYIARIRPDTGLYGGSPFEQAQVDQWLDFLSTEVEPIKSIWIYPVHGWVAFNGKAYAEAKTKMTEFLTIFHNHFLHHTFLVTNQVTIADVHLFAVLAGCYRDIFAPEYIAPFFAVTRWFQTVQEISAIEKAFGKIEITKAEKKAAGHKEKGEGGKDGGKDGGKKAKEQEEKKEGGKKEKDKAETS